MTQPPKVTFIVKKPEYAGHKFAELLKQTLKMCKKTMVFPLFISSKPEN
jgi:hypothetical protein